MKRHIIFASHGLLASGILSSVELILGKQPDIHTLCAYVDEGVDVSRQVNDLLAHFPDGDEIIVITDIFAGSVNNEFIRFIHRPGFHLLAGLNLPLVIELLISAEEENTLKYINEALINSKESIQYCNQTIQDAMHVDKEF